MKASKLTRLIRLFGRPRETQPVQRNFLTVYDNNGRGLRLPEGMHLHVGEGGVFFVLHGGAVVAPAPPFGSSIPPQVLEDIATSVPGCEWVP